MFVKICGITRLADALHAVEQGATALGFVFWPRSPRYVSPERAADIIAALPSAVTSVGVFVNESVDGIGRVVGQTRIQMVQLHGDEPPEYAEALAWPILRSVTLDSASVASGAWSRETTFLLDAADTVRRGGTGVVIDWSRAAGLARQRCLVLAGGLTPGTVADAIAAVQPYGVDVSSGVEESPGIKDLSKVTQFLARARAAFESRGRFSAAQRGER
jgi:phosphoribosylanthranilate isomerase